MKASVSQTFLDMEPCKVFKLTWNPTTKSKHKMFFHLILNGHYLEIVMENKFKSNKSICKQFNKTNTMS